MFDSDGTEKFISFLISHQEPLKPSGFFKNLFNIRVINFNC